MVCVTLKKIDLYVLYVFANIGMAFRGIDMSAACVSDEIRT